MRSNVSDEAAFATGVRGAFRQMTKFPAAASLRITER